MPTALMSNSLLSSLKPFTRSMTADLVTDTPTGEVTTRVRVLSYHLDCEHGLIAHIIPFESPSPLGEGRGEGSEGEASVRLDEQSPSPEAAEFGVGFFVPFSTLTNIRHTPSPRGEGRGEGSGEQL